MKLLFASAEIYPYAKTGGLADVAQALPKTLLPTIEVRSIMPLYSFINREAYDIKETDLSFLLTMNGKIHTVSLFRGINEGVETLFIYEPLLCNKPSLYGNKKGDYPNNDIRFGLFSKAIIIVAEHYNIDVLHLNDWHTALAALWAREMLPDLRTVFTIHNLAFQGLFPEKSMRRLGLDSHYFTPEGIEFWGQMNCIKAGIAYSDVVTTVSPRYAQEIVQAEFGCGLDGFLQVHQHKLHGILNGIDTQLFDPELDPSLAQNYSQSSLEGKKENKHLYCKTQGFKDIELPLVIFIGRFTQQKGLDIIIQALPKLLKMKLNFSIIGEGDPRMASILRDAAKKNKNFSIFFGYKESLSHQMYAAADFLLMPSSFEPCGLNQLISLRYGTMPIVHRVGGIYDTIHDLEDHKSSTLCGQGIAMTTYDVDGLLEAVKRALKLYSSSNTFEKAANRNMHCDVSFTQSAKSYIELYKEE